MQGLRARPQSVGDDPDDRHVVVLRRRIAVAACAVAGWTAASAFVPALRVSLFSPDLRVVMETVGLCVALFAAFALLVPVAGEEADPARNAFVAALVMLGTSNAVFGVGPILLLGETASGSARTFYPWLAARYLAGLLFIVATVRPPRLGVRAYVALTLAGLAVADVAVVLLGDRLPVPLSLEELGDVRGGMAVDVSSGGAALVVAVVPGVLFALGAWLAWRVFLRQRSGIFAWLSLALWLQVVAQVHEVLEPAILGPVISSADVVRSLVLVVLGCGALLHVRRSMLDRTEAVHRQADDLRAQAQLLAEMQTSAEREAAFRTLVVHELATPIATLRGFAQLALSDRLPRHELRGVLQGIESESGRLLHLSHRMEELRSLELGHFSCDLRPVLLRPLLEDAALFLRGLPGTHPAQVSCSEGLRAAADPVLLGQALRNLLTNAARYSPARSPIGITGRAGADGWIELSVTDTGPGVSPRDRRRMLRKYERGASAGATEGTGLGLYIAARIARSHGGRLYLTEGERGRGTRAVLELPRTS